MNRDTSDKGAHYHPQREAISKLFPPEVSVIYSRFYLVRAPDGLVVSMLDLYSSGW